MSVLATLFSVSTGFVIQDHSTRHEMAQWLRFSKLCLNCESIASWGVYGWSLDPVSFPSAPKPGAIQVNFSLLYKP